MEPAFPKSSVNKP